MFSKRHRCYNRYNLTWGSTNIPRIWKTPQNSRRQKGDMQQVFHTEGPQISGVTVPNTIARAKWHPRFVHGWLNRLTPNDPHMGRTAPLTSKRCISYIYSTNTGTEYFKHALYSPFFFLFKMQFVS